MKLFSSLVRSVIFCLLLDRESGLLKDWSSNLEDIVKISLNLRILGGVSKEDVSDSLKDSSAQQSKVGLQSRIILMSSDDACRG